MAAVAWPTSPPSWLLPWLIWRFRGQPAPKPLGIPKTIPKWAWAVLQWCAWRRKGAIPADRPDVVKTIPQWGWSILKQLNIAVPLAPPPPPPPPANPIPANSWKLPFPVLFTAWGWRVDSDWRDRDTGIERAVAAGVRTIALQGGYFDGVHAERVRQHGLKVAVWASPSAKDAGYLELAQADGYIPQIEGPHEYTRAIAQLEAGVGAGLSLSTVTTLAGLETFIRRPNGTPEGESSTVEVEALIDAGLTHAMVECYLGDMTPVSVPDRMWSMGHRGIYYGVPTIGLAGRSGVSINETYKPGIDPYGRRIAVYLAEPMRPIDWQELGAL